jgi:hypothetical protein
MVSSSKMVAFLGFFSNIFKAIRRVPLAIKVHDIGFQLVGADLAIGGVEVGEELQGNGICKSHGFIAELIDEERIDGNDELGLEGSFDSEVHGIFCCWVCGEFSICLCDLIAGGVGID